MSENTDKIILLLKSLTLLEASELVAEIEDTFGVDSSISAGPALVTLPNAGGTQTSDEEQTEFSVILEGVENSSDRIKVIKVIRSLTSLGLKEAKGLVEAAPKVVKEDVSKDEATDIQNQLKDAGAKVSVK